MELSQVYSGRLEPPDPCCWRGADCRCSAEREAAADAAMQMELARRKELAE